MARFRSLRVLSLIAGTGILIAAENIRVPLSDAVVASRSGSFSVESSYPGTEPVRSALPEPATIMLFGTVAWFVGSRLRRNGRESSTAALHRSPASVEQTDNGRAMRGISLHDPSADADGPAD